MKKYRHGDLIISKIDQLPEGLTKRKGDIILAGEATGHNHRIKNGSIFEKGDLMYLVVKKGGKLTHEEHAAIELPSGKYAVLRTREWDYSAAKARAVID